MKYQQWNIAQGSQQDRRAMERLGVPTLVAATLCARGMTDLDEAKSLLSSAADQIQDPFLMKDMDLAAARIGRALRNGEKIAVYGDYDVDGITSTCLLTRFLSSRGARVIPYIPDRLEEGYGLNREAVELLADKGVTLIVTVDCGITAVEETGVSRVLVTDTAGRILYDTREGDNARGLYAFYTEIAQALRGNDTFYCRYDGEAFLSRGASPVVYHNQIVGAVYAYEYDTVQAELLRSFQTNIMRISLLVALFVLFLSALLSRMFTRRISDLLQAIRQVREGAYSHRAKVTGSDEIAQLAAEFNSLTDRLQRTESAENAAGGYPPADGLHSSDRRHER